MPLVALAVLSMLLTLGPPPALVWSLNYGFQKARVNRQASAVVRLGESVVIGQAASSVHALCDAAAHRHGFHCTRTETGIVAAPARALVFGRRPVLHVELDGPSTCQRVSAVRYSSSGLVGSDEPATGSPPPRP